MGCDYQAIVACSSQGQYLTSVFSTRSFETKSNGLTKGLTDTLMHRRTANVHTLLCGDGGVFGVMLCYLWGSVSGLGVFMCFFFLGAEAGCGIVVNDTATTTGNGAGKSSALCSHPSPCPSNVEVQPHVGGPRGPCRLPAGHSPTRPMAGLPQRIPAAPCPAFGEHKPGLQDAAAS